MIIIPTTLTFEKILIEKVGYYDPKLIQANKVLSTWKSNYEYRKLRKHNDNK